jgi:hypothetical protein
MVERGYTTMARKLTQKWRDNIVSGKRKAKAKRRAAGLLSLVEISVIHQVPLTFLRRMAVEGKLAVIGAGRRRYVRKEVAAAVFGKTGRSAA